MEGADAADEGNKVRVKDEGVLAFLRVVECSDWLAQGIIALSLLNGFPSSVGGWWHVPDVGTSLVCTSPHTSIPLFTVAGIDRLC